MYITYQQIRVKDMADRAEARGLTKIRSTEAETRVRGSRLAHRKVCSVENAGKKKKKEQRYEWYLK